MDYVVNARSDNPHDGASQSQLKLDSLNVEVGNLLPSVLLGGAVRLENAMRAGEAVPAASNFKAGRCITADRDHVFFYFSRGPHSTIVERPGLSVILRGYASSSSSDDSVPTGTTDYICEYYSQHGSIPIDNLEGSFCVVILDSLKQRILIYRNLAGTSNVYYRHSPDRFIFSTNLRDLHASFGDQIRLNTELLPVYFLFRCIPGRETLFRDVCRVMPGELLQFDNDILTHRRVRSFQDFKGRVSVDGKDVIEQLDDTLSSAMRACLQTFPSTSVLLSGGVDSSLLQSHWNSAISHQCEKQSFCVTVDHSMTKPEFEYASSAADQLDTRLTGVSADRPYSEYLAQVIEKTAETPGHVQAAYFPVLAREMVRRGIDVGISGEAGDGIFGVGTAYELQLAKRLRGRIRLKSLCLLLSSLCFVPRLKRLKLHLKNAAHVDDLDYFFHPINLQATFGHLPSVVACFGEVKVHEALAYRRALIVENGLSGSLVGELHAANILTSSINSASFWNTLFETEGAYMVSPFLDSRVLRLAMNIDDTVRFEFREPKKLLKECLSRRTTRELAYRAKRGFGQPIFEWLREGGQLRCLVDEIAAGDFVDDETFRKARNRPNWFLYNLLCLDRLRKTYQF